MFSGEPLASGDWESVLARQRLAAKLAKPIRSTAKTLHAIGNDPRAPPSAVPRCDRPRTALRRLPNHCRDLRTVLTAVGRPYGSPATTGGEHQQRLDSWFPPSANWHPAAKARHRRQLTKAPAPLPPIEGSLPGSVVQLRDVAGRRCRVDRAKGECCTWPALLADVERR